VTGNGNHTDSPPFGGLFVFYGGFIPTCQPGHSVKLAKQEKSMKALNCRLGDLAVTVRAELPENIGVIVRVIGCHGVDEWWGFDVPTHLWEVQAIEGAHLTYEFEDGSRKYKVIGLAPDAFLRPIAPLWTADTVTKTVEEHCHV